MQYVDIKPSKSLPFSTLLKMKDALMLKISQSLTLDTSRKAFEMSIDDRL